MHDTCYFSNSDSQLSYIYTAYTWLACVAFATILHFQTLVTCQASTWLVVTRLAADHPSSVLSQAFHQSSYSRWLCPLTWTWTWNSTMLSSLSPASCGLIDHRAFFTDSTKRPPILCVFTTKRAPSGIRLGATWRSLLMILLTSAFHCVVCLLIALPNSACACVRNVVWFKAISISWINLSSSVGHPPLWPVA